jgi:hypothetical protein
LVFWHFVDRQKTTAPKFFFDQCNASVVFIVDDVGFQKSGLIQNKEKWCRLISSEAARTKELSIVAFDRAIKVHILQ